MEPTPDISGRLTVTGSRLAEPEMEPTPDEETRTPPPGPRLAEPEMEPTPDMWWIGYANPEG